MNIVLIVSQGCFRQISVRRSIAKIVLKEIIFGIVLDEDVLDEIIFGNVSS